MPGLDAKLHDEIHKTYGSLTGLMKDEYHCFFDPNAEKWDVQIQAGKIVHILIKTAPNMYDFEQRMKNALGRNNPPLRAFLRPEISLDGPSSIGKYEHLNLKFGEEQLAKRPTVQSYIRAIFTSICVTDKKTKKSVEIVVRNSDYITAQEMALKQLYGERWEE